MQIITRAEEAIMEIHTEDVEEEAAEGLVGDMLEAEEVEEEMVEAVAEDILVTKEVDQMQGWLHVLTVREWKSTQHMILRMTNGLTYLKQNAIV